MRLDHIAKKIGNLVLASSTKISSVFFGAIAVTMAGGLVTAISHSGPSNSAGNDERFPASMEQRAGENDQPRGSRVFPGSASLRNGTISSGSGSGAEAASAMANQLQEAAREQSAQNSANAVQPEPISVTPDAPLVTRDNPGQALLTSSDSNGGSNVDTGTSTSTSTSSDANIFGAPALLPSSTATSTSTDTTASLDYTVPASLSLTTSANGWAEVCQTVAIDLLDITGSSSSARYSLTVTLNADQGSFYSDSGCLTSISSAAFSTGTSSLTVYFKSSTTASVVASEPTLSDATGSITIASPTAEFVEGQSTFTTNTANTGGLGGATLSAPDAVLKVNGKLIVADTANNRVLIWNTAPTSSHASADVVLGQPNTSSNTANNGGVSATSLSGPNGLASDGTRLIVSDAGNNRVLIWDTFPSTTHAAASHVVGQPDMAGSAANNGGLGAATLQTPSCVQIYSSKLLVCDKTNNRVLVWTAIPIADGVSATFAVGQPDLVTASAATSATKLSAPYDAIVSNSRLYVSDHGNNRIAIWPSFPTSSGASATIALGQPSLVANAANNGGISAATLSSPARLRVDSQARLIVADSANQRVLVWNKEPAATAAAADGVIGQTNLTSQLTNSGGLSSTSLDAPLGIEVSGSELWVNDSANNRVLKYALP